MANTYIKLFDGLSSKEAQFCILSRAIQEERKKLEKRYEKVTTAAAIYKYEYLLNAIGEIESALDKAITK